jgi:two-component system sensor histidine kinase RpfC
MVSPAAQAKSLRLLLRVAPATPHRWVGDPHHLREVLLNLLSNAIKFTHSGYVALQVEPVVLHEDGARLRFEVRDTGIGIAPEALERIWESFAQEDTGTSRHYGGTGLGTTIARHLVELMGGRIAVSSIKGRGTVFWFELPLRRQAGPAAAETAVPGARVLLLSADPAAAQSLQPVVERLHGVMVTVTSPADAVAALGRAIRLGNPWQLLLVDDLLAVPPGAGHGASELVTKALATHTPLYLLTDTAYDVERLCEWGYAGTFARWPAPAMLASAIHASPHFETDAPSGAAPGVVRVEPWAWGRSVKAARRVLVADDNRTNRLILEQMLESAGYAAEVAGDGETALERLAAGGFKAAVIDLHMPGLDGVDLLRRYRLLRPSGRIPIVMLTADATFSAKSECADAGADAFLTKPVTAETLLSTLERLIHERDVRALPGEAAELAEPAGEGAVLDVSVLAELDRLCRDPARLAAVIEAFDAEAEGLLARMAEAVVARNYPAFAEWVHALKGNAANVGAARLAAACRRTEAAGVLEFRRDGAGQVRELRARFTEARQALHEFVPGVATPGRSGPG